MLNRAGAANSTGGVQMFGKLSEALLGRLAQQDVARERELMQRRLQAALAGGQFISGVSNAGRVTQQPADSGFLGAMAPLVGAAAGAALTGGIGAAFAPAAAGASAGSIGLAGPGAFTGLA